MISTYFKTNCLSSFQDGLVIREHTAIAPHVYNWASQSTPDAGEIATITSTLYL
jgi:hypothetical protein